MPKGRGRRSASTKTSPYSREGPASRAKASSVSDSPKRESGATKDVVKIVDYKELSGINQNLQPDKDGMMKLSNSQQEKWDLASKIQAQVIERDVELRFVKSFLSII